MTVQIFKNYDEFLAREDKLINGVSQKFLTENNLTLENVEKSLINCIACWNCYNCENCNDCGYCTSCQNCEFCVACKNCKNCGTAENAKAFQQR